MTGWCARTMPYWVALRCDPATANRLEAWTRQRSTRPFLWGYSWAARAWYRFGHLGDLVRFCRAWWPTLLFRWAFPHPHLMQSEINKRRQARK